MAVTSQSTNVATGVVTIEAWDATAGTYTRTENGDVVEERPLTPEEVTSVESAEQLRIAEANSMTLTSEIQSNIDTLLVTVDNLNAITDLSNATINANPAAVIKDVAREVKTVARQAIRLSRIVSDSLGSTNSGS